MYRQAGRQARKQTTYPDDSNISNYQAALYSNSATESVVVNFLLVVVVACAMSVAYGVCVRVCVYRVAAVPI